MVYTDVLASVITCVVSYMVAWAIFDVLSHEARLTRRATLSAVTSEIMNIVILIWLAKIVTHVDILVYDPEVVLVYPCEAQHLYMALFVEGLWLAYRVWKGRLDLTRFMSVAIPVVLMMSMINEAIHVVRHTSANSIVYLIILVILWLTWLTLASRTPVWLWTHVLVLCWLSSMFTIQLCLAQVTFFGYAVHTTPLILAVVALIINFVIVYRKEQRND